MQIRDLRNGGYFQEYDSKGDPRGPLLKNSLLKTGATYILRTVFRGEAVLPATYYLGLTTVAYTWNSTLADIAVGEPAGHGYARQALTKNTVDWTVQEVSGVMQSLSKIVTFTASSDWDKTWNRMFITDQAAGTAGYVFSISGPAPAPRTVLSGAPPSIDYQYFLRG